MSLKKVKIIEKDLFNFIFHPNHLELDKYNYINSNQRLFAEEIQFLVKLKNQLKIKVSNKIIENILNKINKLNCKSIIKLEKVNTPTNSQNNLLLAAESPTQVTETFSETYQDYDSNYLVKIVTSTDKKKIYIFSRNKPSEENIRLIIHPSKKTFLISSTSEQIMIDPNESIESVSIITSEDLV